MPTNKIHYSGKQSCNNQGFFPHLSSNIEEVTCQGCINQYYRKNLGGRPPKAEKPAYKVAFSISPIAYEILQKVPTGDRSSFVSKLIEESNDLAASCGVSIPLTDNENFDNSGTSQHEINRWKQKFGV